MMGLGGQGEGGSEGERDGEGGGLLITCGAKITTGNINAGDLNLRRTPRVDIGSFDLRRFSSPIGHKTFSRYNNKRSLNRSPESATQ